MFDDATESEGVQMLGRISCWRLTLVSGLEKAFHSYPDFLEVFQAALLSRCMFKV